MFKRLISLSALTVLSASSLAAMPTIPCGDPSTDAGVLNWVSGCYINDDVDSIGYEAVNDIGVKLELHSALAGADADTVRAALAKSIIYVEGWSGSNFRGNKRLNYPTDAFVAVVDIIAGASGADNTVDYSDKIKVALSDYSVMRQGTANPEDLVVVGYSLGGVAARLALAEMENDGIDIETNLFVSWDSPQTGLYTPQMAIQVLPLIDTYLAEAQSFINSQSSILRPMLQPAVDGLGDLRTDLYNNQFVTDFVGSGVFKDSMIDNVLDTENTREALIARLDVAGYPSVRNIAISNGSISSPAPIAADQSGGTYYRFYGRTGGGSQYGFMDFRMHPTVAGGTAVSMNVGAFGSYTRKYKCFWFFTCTSVVNISASLPRSIAAPSDAMELDNVPGALATPVPLILSSGTSKLLNNFFPASADQTNLNARFKTEAELGVLSTQLAAAQSIAEFNQIAIKMATLEEVDNAFNYPFVPTASAFGIAPNSEISMLENAYADPSLTPFDALYSIAEEQHQMAIDAGLSDLPATAPNLMHSVDYAGVPAWSNEILCALSLTGCVSL